MLEQLALEPLALVVSGKGRDGVGGEAENLGGGVAVEPLGAEVPVRDAEVRVGAHDAVLEHVEQVSLVLLQHVSRPAALHGCVLPRWRVATRLHADLNPRGAELAGARPGRWTATSDGDARDSRPRR